MEEFLLGHLSEGTLSVSNHDKSHRWVNLAYTGSDPAGFCRDFNELLPAFCAKHREAKLSVIAPPNAVVSLRKFDSLVGKLIAAARRRR